MVMFPWGWGVQWGRVVHADWSIGLYFVAFLPRLFLCCPLHHCWCCWSPAVVIGPQYLHPASSCYAESTQHVDLIYIIVHDSTSSAIMLHQYVSLPLTSSFNLWHISLSLCFSSNSFSRITFLSNAYQCIH